MRVNAAATEFAQNKMDDVPAKGIAPAAYWNSDREAIGIWLHEKKPSLAELYRSAVEMVESEPPFPGRTRFVAHAVREIGNRLPEAVTLKEYKEKADTTVKTAIIVRHWNSVPRAGAADGGTPLSEQGAVPTRSEISISAELYGAIEDLVREFEKPEVVRRRKFQEMIEVATDAGVKTEVSPAVVQQWITVTDWFMDFAHDNGRPDADCDWVGYKTQFGLFETALKSLAQPFFKTKLTVEEMLKKANAVIE